MRAFYRPAAPRRMLHVPHRTVDHHVAAILRKLGVRNRAQAVREGGRLGLLGGGGS